MDELQAAQVRAPELPGLLLVLRLDAVLHKRHGLGHGVMDPTFCTAGEGRQRVRGETRGFNDGRTVLWAMIWSGILFSLLDW